MHGRRAVAVSCDRFGGLEVASELSISFGFCRVIWCGSRAMGRAGLEPATLGLKVRQGSPQRPVMSRNLLQRTRSTVELRRSEMQKTETNRYSKA
jgi:hypothetical protein